MKASINDFWAVLIVNASCLYAPASGQSYLETLAKEDREIVSSIAPYREAIRTAVLDISQYPQALVKLERIQAKSSQSFKDLVSGCSKADQTNFYDISRYPEILKLLVREGRKSPQEARFTVIDLPAGSQARILKFYESHFKVLQIMDQMLLSSQIAFKKIISVYPPDTQDDFLKIISKPDIMNLLTDNIDLTLSLGEAYKANPHEVSLQLDSLHNQLTNQDEKDLSDYEAAIDADPKMQEEMKGAASDFSASYAQGSNLNTSNDINQNSQQIASQETLTDYSDYNPFPYWFGYPYWYNAPMWYPMPYYYNTGFYYGLGGSMVVVGLPSHFYANWFFNSGFHNYPLLYRHYNTYYKMHRKNILSVSMYRGFNEEANDHFSGRSHDGAHTTAVKVIHPNATTIDRNAMGVGRSSGTVAFNNHGFQEFHASSSHRVGWAHTRAASRRGTISGVRGR
ncbi:MAG TPA: hypothetical protein VL728_12010 [Cyclobacteriaceae bacterium]|jgi:hypothetical protein|nr:hypothetical protein [Cyclobacteriaceae bacterium]